VLLAWVALLAVAIGWGEHVVAVGDTLRVNAPPLTGSYRWHLGRGVIAPVLVGVVAVVLLPHAARRWEWSRLLGAVGVTATGWALALGALRGGSGITGPLTSKHEYVHTVARVGDPGRFLAGFTDHLAGYTIHTQGHPPGMVLVLWLLDRVGLGGVGPNAVLVYAGGAAAVLAALVTVRAVAGEEAGRRAAPFLALTPAAIWWSSGDAFFAGVGAWAVTLVVLAAVTRQSRRGDAAALVGGVLFGVTALLSYGLVLLALVPLTVAAARRRARVLAVAAVGAAAVLGACALAGFWWFDGLAATHARYYAGVGGRRPYSYFVVGNVAVFALALGPAVAVALARLRDQRVWLLAGSALVAVAIADLSGMSKAEVERIWLPFVPWVVLATASLAGTSERRGGTAGWLAAQVATGLAVEVTVRSPW
jgi:hypothetical protein